MEITIIVTGGSGFLGSALIDRLVGCYPGATIYDLSRHPKPRPPFVKGGPNVIPLVGDITELNLGLTEDIVPKDISTVYHLAAVHDLGPDPKGIIQRTNVDGTRNIIDFCKKYGVGRLLFCSTAYTNGHNPYENSKTACEEMVAKSGIPYVIFKPSIIMGSDKYQYSGHFLQFIMLIIRLHRMAETIRRSLEGSMRLPAIRPVFRIPGDPMALLNLVSVEDVAERIAQNERGRNIEDSGTFWLTNPKPPRLQELCDWVSEVILVDLKMAPDKFPAMPLESALQQYGKAFLPYLRGDHFDNVVTTVMPDVPIDKGFIQRAVQRAILEGGKDVVI